MLHVFQLLGKLEKSTIHLMAHFDVKLLFSDDLHERKPHVGNKVFFRPLWFRLNQKAMPQRCLCLPAATHRFLLSVDEPRLVPTGLRSSYTALPLAMNAGVPEPITLLV